MASKKESDKTEREASARNTASALGVGVVTERYGRAIEEDIVGWSGVRVNADGSTEMLQKGYASIGNYNINPQYAEQNIAQQAGYDAEVLYSTQKTKEAILAGNDTRTARVDDITDENGRKRVNDPVSDIAQTDTSGNVIEGSEAQMKFVKDPTKICDSIAKGDSGRYRGHKLILPSEQVEATKAYCTAQVDKCQEQAQALREQAAKLEAKGDIEGAKAKLALAETREQAAENYKELAGNIEDAGFTTEQAKAYRLNPVKETLKSIASTAHDAGLEGAKYGAAIGGSISLFTNLMAVAEGDKKLSEALKETAKGTAKSAALGYGTAAAGMALKATMAQAYGALETQAVEAAKKVVKEAAQESGKKASTYAVKKAAETASKEFAESAMGMVARRSASLSRTNLPALAVTICLESGKLIHHSAKGEIDGLQFMEKMGEKGSSMLASSAMATIGQIAIPIPVVGAAIGGMIGYTLSSMFYNSALEAFKGANKAWKDYAAIKARFEEAQAYREYYRAELSRLFREHMDEQKRVLETCFYAMDNASCVDDFAIAANHLGRSFGKNLQFATRHEFDQHMASNKAFIL